ncbi:MAG: tetratricopeptide repeat protein, partial [Chloroflexi bacterium]|nr:tetratricopeptide repeat protein [Chloroflexota bacterium]
TQEFLCQTAILDHLEASLCDAVTGRSDSRHIFEQLDREYYFIVPLDDDRRWYRYHRLMVEALRRKTEGLDKAQLAELHRRASIWYEEQVMIDAAIDHAFKASDLDRAAELIESGAEAILKRSQVVKLLEWLGRLSEEQIRERPRLNIAYAWALLLKGGSIHAVKARLEASATLTAGALVSAEEAVIRALIATSTGDVNQGFAYSHRALDELPADRIFLRSVALETLGMGYVFQGDIQSAIQAFKESIALARDSGNTMFAVASLSNLGGIYLIQGHLKFAEAVYHQALELATTQFGQRLPVACRALMGLSEITREWDNLGRARELLEEALQLSQQYSETGELVMYLSLARVLQAQGNVEKAVDLVQKAQAIAIQSTATAIDDRLVEVALVRLWLQQGNMAGAGEWADRRGFEPDLSREALSRRDTHIIPYDLREGEWLLYARLQLAQNRAEAAVNTLAMLLSASIEQSRTRHLLEILILMALAYQATGSVDLAVDALERSLKLAEPEGYVRVYIDEGPPMIKLLREAARRGIKKQYCNRLLSTFQQEDRILEHASGEDQTGLVEPLSGRELEVLQLLAEGCTNREVGERLYLSLSTVKGHISNINGKLDARNRTEAVARARQLGILPGN